jgi:hypothetical protein
LNGQRNEINQQSGQLGARFIRAVQESKWSQVVLTAPGAGAGRSVKKIPTGLHEVGKQQQKTENPKLSKVRTFHFSPIALERLASD